MFGKKKSDNNKNPETYIKNKQNEMIRLVKSTFDKEGWEYEFDSENNVFGSGFMGDDLPIRILIFVREASVHFICNLYFEAEPDKFKEVCWALNEINKKLTFGAFYLDLEDGQITFEYGMIFIESNLSEGALASIIRMLIKTVDVHDGDLQKIAKKSAANNDINPMFG